MAQNSRTPLSFSLSRYQNVTMHVIYFYCRQFFFDPQSLSSLFLFSFYFVFLLLARHLNVYILILCKRETTVKKTYIYIIYICYMLLGKWPRGICISAFRGWSLFFFFFLGYSRFILGRLIILYVRDRMKNNNEHYIN